MSAVGAFDSAVMRGVQALRQPALTGVMRAWTALGGTVAVVLFVLVLVVILWRRGRREQAVVSAVLVVGGMLISTFVKLAVGRGRPVASGALIPMPLTRSFPSGHSMASLCVAVVVAYVVGASALRPAVKFAVIGVAALYALGVGFSRVYLGVHWPSDVVGSWLLGGAWLLLALQVRRIRSRAGAAG